MTEDPRRPKDFILPVQFDDIANGTFDPSVFIPAPESFPENQTPEDIVRILDRAKTGDYAHIFPTGEKQIFCLEHGLPQAYGVVDEGSPEGEVTLWGTLFAMPGAKKAFSLPAARTFGVGDIELIQLVPAEIYIPRETNGKFRYLSKAVINEGPSKGDLITIDSFMDGFISGKNHEGLRATGGIHYFNPIKK